jgi:hypothetical protein
MGLMSPHQEVKIMTRDEFRESQAYERLSDGQKAIVDYCLSHAKWEWREGVCGTMGYWEASFPAEEIGEMMVRENFLTIDNPFHARVRFVRNHGQSLQFTLDDEDGRYYVVK